jgi:hypothetical protein
MEGKNQNAKTKKTSNMNKNDSPSFIYGSPTLTIPSNRTMMM